MKCENCKAIIDGDSKFCSLCGKAINENEEIPKLDKDVPKVLKDVLDHLEFLGYEIGDNFGENATYRVLARNKKKSNYIINFNLNTGFLFISHWLMNKEKLTENKEDFLVILNEINKIATYCGYCLNDECDSLITSAYFPPVYSKALFSNFIEGLENETVRVFQVKGLMEFS